MKRQLRRKTRLAAEKAETADEKTKRTAAEKKAKNARKKATDMVGNLGADGAATMGIADERGWSGVRLSVDTSQFLLVQRNPMMAR